MTPLAQRFLERRESLGGEELVALREELRADPQAASQVRELLVVDEMLHRQHAADRAHFGNRIGAARRAKANQSAFALRVVRARRRARRRTGGSGVTRWFAAAAAALVVAVGGAALLQARHAVNPGGSGQAPISIAHLEALQGEVLDREGRPWLSGAALPAGAQMQARGTASVEVVLVDGSRLALRGGVLGSSSAAAGWQLDAGSLSVSAAHQAPGQQLRITTPQAVIRVVGTRFVLDVDAERTQVAVSDGVVAVTAAGEELRVAAGSSAAIATQSAPLSLDALPVADLVLWLSADAGIRSAADGSIEQWNAPIAGLPAATQTEAGRRPRLRRDGLAGCPAVVFDGVDDRLHLPDGFADFRQGLTAAFVFADRSPPDLTELRLLELGWHDGGAMRFGLRDALLGIASSKESSVLSMVGATPANREAPHLLVMIARPDGSGELRWDGVLTQRGKVVMPPLLERRGNHLAWNQWSGERFFTGAMAEIVVIRRPLADEALRAFEQRLMRRWKLSAAP